MAWLDVNPNSDFPPILHFFSTFSASFHQKIVTKIHIKIVFHQLFQKRIQNICQMIWIHPNQIRISGECFSQPDPRTIFHFKTVLIKVFIIQVKGSISEKQLQDFKRESECPISPEAKSASKIWFPGNSLEILSALRNWLLLSLPFSCNYSHPPYDSPVVHTR